MIFAGELLDGESLEDGARRELAEETTLHPERLEFFTSFTKDPERHGRSGLVHVFVARDVDTNQIHVREGKGFRLLYDEEDLRQPDCSVLTRDILRSFWERKR